MKFLAGLSIVLVLSVVSPPDTQAYYNINGLTVSPSARINGMGEAGVAVVGQDSFWYNPASLGFLAGKYRFSASFFPIRSHYWGDRTRFRNLQFLSASGSLLQQGGKSHIPVSVGMSVYRTDFDAPTGNEIRTRTTADVVSLGISRSGGISFAVGVTYKFVDIKTAWIDWDIPMGHYKGRAIDLGLMIGGNIWPRQGSVDVRRDGFSVPFKLGISWNNVYGDLERTDYAEISHNLLHEVRRIGFSLGAIHAARGLEDFSVLVALEYEEVFASLWRPRPKLHLGIELAIEQVVTLRVGHVDEEDREGNISTGFTLSTKGLTRKAAVNAIGSSNHGVLGSLVRKLALEFSMSHYPRRGDMMYKSVYRSLEVQWLF